MPLLRSCVWISRNCQIWRGLISKVLLISTYTFSLIKLFCLNITLTLCLICSSIITVVFTRYLKLIWIYYWIRWILALHIDISGSKFILIKSHSYLSIRSTIYWTRVSIPWSIYFNGKCWCYCDKLTIW